MKESLSLYIKEYRKQMLQGNIPKAYKGLLEYMMNLRTHFINQHPTDFVVGALYQGYMDITYFPFTPISLKQQKLKTGLVFNHQKIRFEIWLVGQNKKIQKKYWEAFKNIDWNKYPTSSTAQHSIIEHILVENPDFDELHLLTKEIEAKTFAFISTLQKVLNGQINFTAKV